MVWQPWVTICWHAGSWSVQSEHSHQPIAYSRTYVSHACVYTGNGKRQSGLSKEELSSACEMLASDAFLCLIYSVLLYFFDEHILSSRYFSVKLIPKASFAAWAASRAAQLDFAWAGTVKDTTDLSDWPSQKCTLQRQEARFYMVQQTFKDLKDALAKSPHTGISFSIPALLAALRFTVNRATYHMYPRWLQSAEGAAAVKVLDQTVTGWLDPHGYFSSMAVIAGGTATAARRTPLPPIRRARMHFNDVSPHVVAVVGTPESDGARRVMYQAHRVRDAQSRPHHTHSFSKYAWPALSRMCLSQSVRLQMATLCTGSRKR
eukprot:jgi/Ulvmu1/11579/UM079_0022.1